MKMNDLISRQAVIDILDKWILRAKHPCNKSQYNSGEIDAYESVMCDIEELPPVEPERKKGHWIVKEEDWRKQLEWDECSECGFATTKQYNFCPNCGADMRDDK